MLQDHRDEARFLFVLRRLWFEFNSAPPRGWQRIVAQRYKRFVEQFQWGSDEPQFSHPLPLVERTLSVWQRRLPTLLTVRHANEMLSNVQGLSRLPGGLR